MNCRAAVIGCSAGGMQAAAAVLSQLGPDCGMAVILVQHLHREQGEELLRYYARHSPLQAVEAVEREKALPGRVHVAPPGYHLLLERDETFSLSVDEKVNWSRPSVDVLFDSAADVYGPALAGIILSGANSDGALGLKKIKVCGGVALVQDPATAQFPEMPRCALRSAAPDHVLPPEEIGRWLAKMAQPFAASPAWPR